MSDNILYAVTPIDKVIYLFLSPAVALFCIGITIKDFGNYKELIIKRKRVSLYLALYLLLIVSIIESMDILSVLLNTHT